MQFQGVDHLLAGGLIQVAEVLFQLEELQAVAALNDGAGPLIEGRLFRIELGQDFVLVAQDQTLCITDVHGISHWKMTLGSR